ncbi:hypothetical protein B0H14DRAFT_3000104, partial [Mycena olivaceomarginata]
MSGCSYGHKLPDPFRMFFHQVHFFGLFLLLSRFPQASSLTFEPILGPFNTGEQVPIQWTLDDSEPADGWELWFGGGGSAFKLADIPPLVVSTVVPFPGSNGTFRGLSGIVVLATSNEVDVATSACGHNGNHNFSASVISGPSSVTSSSTSDVGSTSPPPPTSAAETAKPSRSSALTTEAILGIVVGTLAVIAALVLVSIFLFVRRRRRAAAVTKAYPSETNEVDSLLARRLPPFDFQRWPPPRISLPSARSSSGDPTPGAYLNTHVRQLQVPQDTTNTESSMLSSSLSGVSSVSYGKHTPRLLIGELSLQGQRYRIRRHPPPNPARTAHTLQNNCSDTLLWTAYKTMARSFPGHPRILRPRAQYDNTRPLLRPLSTHPSNFVGIRPVTCQVRSRQQSGSRLG